MQKLGKMENTIQSAKAFLKQNEVYSEYRVVCDKLPEESKQVAELLVAYAESVRPEVVVPKAKIIEPYMNSRSREIIIAQNDVIEHVKSLNPTLTFTELNHEK